MQKITAQTLKGLRLMNDLLREQNAEIRNNIKFKKDQVENTLASLSGLNGQLSPFASTPLTSFNPMLQNNVYAPLTLDWTILMYAYKTHGIIQTLCEVPVLDALRGGLMLRSRELEPKRLEEIEDVWEDKGFSDKVAMAKVWARLFGGGALILSTDTPMDVPLDLRQVGRSKTLDLYAANRWELAAPWRLEPMTHPDGKYNFYGKEIHVSRVLTMTGKEAPYLIRWQLAGWGMSELERVIEDFNTYIRVKNVIYELLYEAKIDIYRFKDFAATMLSAEAETAANRRMQIMNSQKNYNSALLLDKEDEYEFRQMSFSGLADIYREARIEMAAALRMPMSKIFGLPSTSFSSGEDDIENYNGMIESEIRRPLRPIIRQLLDLICVMLYGQVYDLDFDFKPLRVLGAKEEEEIKTSKFNRFMQLFNAGLIESKDLGQMLQKEKLIEGDINIVDRPSPIDELAAQAEEGGPGPGGDEGEE